MTETRPQLQLALLAGLLLILPLILGCQGQVPPPSTQTKSELIRRDVSFGITGEEDRLSAKFRVKYQFVDRVPSQNVEVQMTRQIREGDREICEHATMSYRVDEMAKYLGGYGAKIITRHEGSYTINVGGYGFGPLALVPKNWLPANCDVIEPLADRIYSWRSIENEFARGTPDSEMFHTPQFIDASTIVPLEVLARSGHAVLTFHAKDGLEISPIIATSKAGVFKGVLVHGNDLMAPAAERITTTLPTRWERHPIHEVLPYVFTEEDSKIEEDSELISKTMFSWSHVQHRFFHRGDGRVLKTNSERARDPKHGRQATIDMLESLLREKGYQPRSMK